MATESTGRAMRSGKRAARGFTALELVMVLVVLSLCLVPALSLQVEATSQTAFTTGHAHAFLRASQILEMCSARGFDALVAESGGGTLPKCPALGTVTVTIVGERAEFEELEPGLGRLQVLVEWSPPREAIRHRIRLFRIVTRPDASWRETIPLPGGARPPARIL